MSWTLFRATLHQHRTSIFWFTVGLVFYTWVMTWFYPTIGEEYARMIETFPPELLADALDPVNIAAYWQPGLIINGDAVAAEYWWLYGAIAVVMLIASLAIFARRDVA
jgi:hypothetical protein